MYKKITDYKSIHFVEQAKSIQIQQGKPYLPMMPRPLHFSYIGHCPKHHTQQATTGHNTQQQDPTFHSNIMSLLRFCLKGTHFTFQGKYYKHIKGNAMRSLLSPLVANLFMEDFQTRALGSSPNPLRVWLRFVDDTFVIP